MVYLDYNATTPLDPRVIDAMMSVLTDKFGNPSSTTHSTGMDAMDLVDTARKYVANVVGREAPDVIFTSGATEANNMIIAGLGLDLENNHRVLYGVTEHKSVVQPCLAMQEYGLESLSVPVDVNGVINLDKLQDQLRVKTDLVSVMAANSETGVINPIKEISEIVHEYGAMLHCDATQAVGKIPFNADELDVDIVTFSSHKIYGPKGCGAVVATREARKMLRPLIHGGGQERDLRSGTLNVPGIVGFGKACQIIIEDGLDEDVETLRNDLEALIIATIDGVTINGYDAKRLPNTTNFRIRDALADAVLVNAPAIEMSTGSACSSNTMEPSPVLLAMGLDRTTADESIRISLGKPTTQDAIVFAAGEIANAVKFVREKNDEITDSVN